VKTTMWHLVGQVEHLQLRTFQNWNATLTTNWILELESAQQLRIALVIGSCCQQKRRPSLQVPL
jgi:hypothetical protein